MKHVQSNGGLVVGEGGRDQQKSHWVVRWEKLSATRWESVRR